MEDSFSTDGGWGWEDGAGGSVSNGERWGAADEASLTHPPLTSCCAARRLGTPALGSFKILLMRGFHPTPHPHPPEILM